MTRKRTAVQKCECGGARAHHAVDLYAEGCWCPDCLLLPDHARCREWRPAKPPAPADPMAPVASMSALPRKGTLARQVFDLIGSRRGLTDDELEYATGRSHQSVSSARNRLMEDGLVYDSGEVRTTRYGHDATVWKVARLSA